jgi:hypothetical protein
VKAAGGLLKTPRPQNSQHSTGGHCEGMRQLRVVA